MSAQPSLKEPLPIEDDENRHFRTDHLDIDLGRRSARGGAVTIVSQGIKFFMGMAATVVLARLLSPQDYGLIAMVAVVTGFISMFKDLGLSAATIQKEKITADQISTLFWINVGLSMAVMLLTAAVAPGVAWIYGEPRLTLITLGFAAGFLFSGLTVQHEALLKRQMRFAALATMEIMSIVVGLLVAIALAWRGAGYWALVANQLVQGLAYAVGIWIVSGWRPGRPSRYSGIRSMLAFGGNLTGFHVVNYFARNFDNMLIGRFWGSWQLGLYGKAYQLLLLPIDQINAPIASVAIPALSRLTVSPERYRKTYLRILEKLAILTMPGVAFMIASSDWIVEVVLGPQWSGASRIFALLGIVGLIQPIANTTGWLFITQGRTRDMFHWGLIGPTIIIISIVVGLPWGAVGVATSYSVVYLVIVAPLLFWFVGRRGPVRTSDFYRVAAPVVFASVSVLGVLLALRHWLVITKSLAGLALSFAITIAITLMALFVLPKGRTALRDFASMFALLARREEVATIS
jgi:PST family polysaccharide transporter